MSPEGWFSDWLLQDSLLQRWIGHCWAWLSQLAGFRSLSQALGWLQLGPGFPVSLGLGWAALGPKLCATLTKKLPTINYGLLIENCISYFISSFLSKKIEVHIFHCIAGYLMTCPDQLSLKIVLSLREAGMSVCHWQWLIVIVSVMIPKRSLLHIEAGNIFLHLFASTFVILQFGRKNHNEPHCRLTCPTCYQTAPTW